MVNERDILEALKQVKDPDLNRDIVSLGFVQNIQIKGGKVDFDLVLTTPACPVREQLHENAKQAVSRLDGVEEVEVHLTSKVRQTVTLPGSGVSRVKNIIAVGSGKGGVGKSTVAANIAVSLALSGARVGLLDGDIYGPSQAIMMKGGKHIQFTDKKTILPAETHGVKYMSMGFMVPKDKPLIWRGPMAHKAFQESLYNVEWGDLDYLIVDLPPGTGDVHLTLVQSVQVTGGILVSTPQDLGLTISMKTLRMFQTSNVRVLGIVENMSYYLCSHCGHRDEIFGHGRCMEAAKQLGISFLGEIPIDPKIRVQSDLGTPIVIAEPDAPASQAYLHIAKQVAAQVSIASFTPKLEIIEEPA